MGQAAADRRTGERARLGAAGQPEHRQAHSARCRIMVRAGTAGEKRGPTGENRTADEPGQTLNVDRCFVPAVHEVAEHLPAVSGSSGRLVMYGPRLRAKDAERTWPGQVFDDPELSYEAAMREFVWRSAPRTPLRRAARTTRPQRQEALGTLRQQRSLAAQRTQILQPRQQEDAQWQADLEHLQAAPAPPAAKPPWIAILVVTDNCTRQCLGLPLFVAGLKVTAEVVIAALRLLLPEQLPFLISDRGTHFTAQQFAQFTQEEDFVQVLIARHRPESNGIAERFVQTLKAWLADRAWSGTEVLETLLEQFRAAYNDRPHQGLALPGLSPNEFAARFWLL